MRLGLHINRFTWPGGSEEIAPRLVRVAQVAEQLGFERLSVMDHFFQIPPWGAPELHMLEGYTALGYIAAATQRIRLGTLVTGVTYRHPGVLVKAMTTLDVLSRGRAYFGLGAAWFEQEHRGLGIEFPPLKERFEQLEELLQIAKQMWSDNNGPYAGRHYQLQQTLCMPQPIQRPHPPILIGGGGERKTLRLVAQYGDACNLSTLDGMDSLAHKLQVLRAHCDDVKRDYDSIERTVVTRPKPGCEGLLDELRALAGRGIDVAYVSFADPLDAGVIDVLEKLVPAVTQLEVHGR